MTVGALIIFGIEKVDGQLRGVDETCQPDEWVPKEMPALGGKKPTPFIEYLIEHLAYTCGPM